MKRTLLVLFSLFSSVALSDTYYSLDPQKELLGAGFSSQIKMPLTRCVTGDVVYQGGNYGELNYYQEMEDNTVISSLTGSVEGGVNLVIFGGSVKFSIRKKVTKNTNSAASTAIFSYVDGTYTLENRRITDEINSLLATNPRQVAALCGDSYIHSQTRGANLYVTAKLHFRSREEYRRFQVKVKIKVLFVKKTITKTKEFREATQNAVYSVTVNSDGGLTPYLNSLGTSKHCRGTDIDSCIDYAETLFAYLYDEGNYRHDLTSAQLKPIKFTTEEYGTSGHMTLRPTANGNLPEAYLPISARLRGFQDLVNDEIERLTAFLAVATDEERPELENEMSLRQTELTALNAAGDYCATLPGVVTCDQRVEAAIATVH